ncbi:MAG: hypothetical protein ABR564_07060 [Candidatus Dormibacteria bacterium]
MSELIFPCSYCGVWHDSSIPCQTSVRARAGVRSDTMGLTLFDKLGRSPRRGVQPSPSGPSSRPSPVPEQELADGAETRNIERYLRNRDAGRPEMA